MPPLTPHRPARSLATGLVTALVLALAVTLAPVSPATSAPRDEASATASHRSSKAPLFGGTIYRKDGESLADGYDRVMRKYDGLDAIRMFFPGLPSSWDRIRSNVHKTPVVVSFKAGLGDIVSGKHDALFRRWFKDAPTTRPTYWSLWHEPEDDGVNAAQYRKAWRHLKQLSREAHNPRLKSTLILMCWTLDSKSGRNWRTWYPGNRAIHTLAFDCYNAGRKNGVYKDPADILRPVVRVARRTGNKWGVAEFGSTVVTSDGGQAGRARWLRQYGRYVRRHGGQFATYFDSYVGYDYRLHDDRSSNAWRNVVNR